MAETEELKIEQKILDMMEYAYLHALSQYPKSEKFALAADIKRCMDSLLELCIDAKKHHFKKTTLEKMDVQLEKVRKYVRLSFNLKYLPLKKYQVWSEKLDEIGKMLGGWLKTVNSHDSKT